MGTEKLRFAESHISQRTRDMGHPCSLPRKEPQRRLLRTRGRDLSGSFAPEKSPVNRARETMTSVSSHRGGMSIAHVILAGLIALLYPSTAPAQHSFDTDSVAPERFVAVHGRKAVVMGYAAAGLELWAYPLEIASGYELGFRAAGNATEINASTLLRRITYEPDAVVRTYVGPDFVIREQLFVPLNDAAILFTYSVECRHSIDIVIHFTPVLDLMWPAAVGGQYTRWDQGASAYVIGEETHRYSAFIGAPGVIAHDEILNSAQPGALGNHLSFVVRAGGEKSHYATVIVARDDPGASSPAMRTKDLLRAQANLETEARAHYASLAADALRIETPDPAVNQQLAWAQVALDQAWVCNDVLGCGLVAGYGPSRGARRPQYAWFFAGDALITIDALLNTGEYDRAREALAFIARYQDASTGMVWHELSQSANPADWAAKYPYMFVHVDITFQYLITVEHYVAASGDTQFLQQQWHGLEAAYRYCRSLLNAEDGLPRIPSTKEGGDEQDRLSDDLNLSASWVAASAAFSRLARLSGYPTQAEEALQLSGRASTATARRYWDERALIWIDGHNEAGRAVFRRGDDGVRLVNILDEIRSDSVLTQLASSDFETDWGTRGVSTLSPHFDPGSYASGSVSAVGTAEVASTFWSNHRPLTAYPIWSSLIPWGTLDSLGHMHELLTGDFYHQQVESVPEQTWSSAALLSSAVRGLLGLKRETQANRLEFSPHLPSAWDRLSIEHIKMSSGQVELTLSRVPEGLELKANNSGNPVELFFSPEIAFGAHLIGAELNGKPLGAQLEQHPQDTHATLTFTLPTGRSHCLIRYQGGALLSVKESAPLVGESSKAIKISSIADKAAGLVVEADVLDGQLSVLELRTSDKPLHVHGAELKMVADGVYDLVIEPALTPAANSAVVAPGREYRSIEISVDFAGRAGK